MYDLIIVGAGPAGMTAGVYAARKQLKILVLTENIGGQTLLSSAVENYLGYTYLTGPELVARFQEHLDKFDLEIVYDPVSTLTKEERVWYAVTKGGKRHEASAVVVASGKTSRSLGVPGEKEFAGRGVTYCATCDAPVFRGMDVAVVGGGNSGLDATLQLTKIARHVYLIEAGPSLKADDVYQKQARAAANVDIMTKTQVLEVKGDKLVEAIAVRNGQTNKTTDLKVSGVFVEIGLVPNVGFVPKDLHLNPAHEIIVDCACVTNLPGLFAAGDATTVPQKQIIVAAGDGCKAALSAYDYLVREGLI